MESNNEILEYGIKEAFSTMKKNYGGPFGAVIVRKDSKEIISVASNTVLKDLDPTAHAEVNAIRKACKKLGTYDLKDCILYTTCYPCPMCLSACIWANINKIYYACTKEDAAKVGFRDDYIYKFIMDGCIDLNIVTFESLEKKDAISLFEEYIRKEKIIY